MGKQPIVLAILAVALGALMVSVEAGAQDRELPYWASLRYDETRMRVGPSREYPIDWVYRRKGLPLKVIRSRDEWNLVEDPDGTQGWIAQSQLSRRRAALVIGEELAVLREEPQPTGKLRWRAEPGVVAQLLRCREGWCEIDVTGRTGWVEAERLWGDEDLIAETGNSEAGE
ncbi:MAG: SH3 domain-containing protein [Pseudomonadota bacterium]